MMLAALPACLYLAKIITSIVQSNVSVITFFIVYHDIAISTDTNTIVLCRSCSILTCISILNFTVSPASIICVSVPVITFIIPHVKPISADFIASVLDCTSYSTSPALPACSYYAVIASIVGPSIIVVALFSCLTNAVSQNAGCLDVTKNQSENCEHH